MSDRTAPGRRAAIVAAFMAYQDELKRMGAALNDADDLASLMAVSASMVVEFAIRATPEPMQTVRFMVDRMNKTVASMPSMALACAPVAGRA